MLSLSQHIEGQYCMYHTMVHNFVRPTRRKRKHSTIVIRKNTMPHSARKMRAPKLGNKSTCPPLNHDVNIPGPKMGPRPPDFDEKLVRDAPTFKKWQVLKPGQKLRYACRDFVKGVGDDEERLMRRIMIARRNNLKAHDILKKARLANAIPDPVAKNERMWTGNIKRKKWSDDDDDEKEEESGNDFKEEVPAAKNVNPSGTAKRRIAGTLLPVDEDILREMDMPAVEATRTYRKWLTLSDGEELTYNQTYTKGLEGDDWNLKKNIWRRMRYRRENQKLVYKIQHELNSAEQDQKEKDQLVSQAAVEAAAAAAESFVQEPSESEAVVEAATAAYQAVAKLDRTSGGIMDDSEGVGFDASAVTSALDAAARLAATVVPTSMESNEGKDCIISQV
mmetsp:Transcript_22439/g.45554  ORF Transcript_22439/g.45554 Transcript_22439/m.45554 type:complete len:392 (-) Transcript_22439:244-1419(-)